MSRTFRTWTLLLLFAVSGGQVVTAASSVPSAETTTETTATRVAAAPIVIDGHLDDEMWRSMPPTGGFLQRDPREGAPATEATDFRVAYDDRALYVAVMAHDSSPDRIVGLRTRRDDSSPSDWIRVLIDSWHDRLTAYEFAVNPAGVRQDRYWFNDGNSDDGWDAVWDVAVGRTVDGWSAEFRIPLSQLRYRPGGESAFGFAIIREVPRLNEISTWPLLPRSARGFVSQFGRLSGLTLDRSSKRLEVVPYTVADVHTRPADPENPLVEPTDPGAKMGLDFKYGLSRGATLTGTVNPDFGQVEADPAVVNLSAFETFFPERRPFFLEGSGIFRFDIDCSDGECTGLFYSRRIGRSPRGEPEVPDGGAVVSPTETSILGAVKLTGRAGAYSFGALNAVTSNERATLQLDDGTRTRPIVEPVTSYSVVRTRREWQNQSSLGMMLTAANRSVPAELADAVPSQAYAVGFDGDWRLSKRFGLTGYWAASRVAGNAGVIESVQNNARHYFQRPDATYVTFDPARTSLRGHAGMISFNKNGGERTRFSTVATFKSPGFDINELGYERRADEQNISNWFQLRHDRPWHGFRTLRANINQWVGWNFGGDRLSNGGNVNAHFTLMSNWYGGGGHTWLWRRLDDRFTRGGPGAYLDNGHSAWAYVGSDDRRPVSGELNGFAFWDGHNSKSWECSPRLTVRPSSALSVTLGLLVARNRDQEQWVDNIEDASTTHYVFGRLDQKTTAVSLRVNYAVSPKLSLQVYGRPFVSAGRYAGYRELIDGRAPVWEDRYAAYAYPDDADFGYRSFRTTNVLRWEYRPGSTLFVVWQQGRDAEDASPRAARALGSAFSAPAENVFLLKIAYWLNP